MTQVPVIAARGLCKSYRGGRVTALSGVDFVVAPGEVVAVSGASGSGKSSLLYALAGLSLPDAGEVVIRGWRPSSRAAWTTLRRDTIGIVFQDDWLLPALTAAENVELPMIGAGLAPRDRRIRAEVLLERVNASGFRDRSPAELSGGERQRVAVARALANRPDILLADEPTGALDSVNGRRVIELIFDLQRTEGLTVVMVTHDPEIAAACPRSFVMRDGRGTFREGPGA